MDAIAPDIVDATRAITVKLMPRKKFVVYVTPAETEKI